MLLELNRRIQSLADPKKAKLALRYFKTGEGEYGEGDIFLGIRAPDLRILSKEYRQLPIEDCFTLLKSQYHESRMLALFILVLKFKKAKGPEQDLIRTYIIVEDGRVP